MKAAIMRNSSLSFKNVPGYDLYPVSGATSDWWYDEGPKAPLSYTIECRDTGRDGFLLPPRYIVPAGQEQLEAFLAFIDDVAAYFAAHY
mmetsp:Transcript_40527/g.99552  ORF Transcript_40527/g.99552 Transcript_40527/m.99552 type:complete len:89 (+) Transcript_40527:224-490(+)